MADKNVQLHDASGNDLYPKTKAGNLTGTLGVANGGTGQTTKAAVRNTLGLGNTTGALPIANGGTGQTTAGNALNALLGHGSKNFTIIAYVNSSYEVNFTYNELGIPAGGTMIMASLNQTHWSGDDVYHSVWQGFSWNDSDRMLKIRFWSTRSSQASVPFRLDYIYTK